MIMLWHVPWGILHLNPQLPILVHRPFLEQLFLPCFIHLNQLHYYTLVSSGLEQLTRCLCHLIFPVEEMRNLKASKILQFDLGSAATPTGGHMEDRCKVDYAHAGWTAQCSSASHWPQCKPIRCPLAWLHIQVQSLHNLMGHILPWVP